MKKVLIMCNSDPQRDPRPNRMINWLKKDYHVTVIGQFTEQMDGVESLGLFSRLITESSTTAQPPKVSKLSSVGKKLPELVKVILRGPVNLIRKIVNFTKRLKNYFVRTMALKTKNYEPLVWANLGRAQKLQSELAEKDFALIITHDITLMPLACGVKNGTAKILLDAREYYPKNFDDDRHWRQTIKPFNVYLCKEYLRHCDKIITVSDGLAQEYAREYQVYPEVIMSLPTYRDLLPVQVKGDAIKIIHHGYAGFSRKTELMVEMMDYIDERYSLDLMLLVGKDKYWDKVVSMVNKRKNVRLIPPVPMDQIVPVTNQYDIGLFLCPPSNFNLTYTLPNKFFEFIQARLAVAIGPNIEMNKIVKAYDCGIVSSDFTPPTLAKELNRLTSEKIMYYKGQSHKAAMELNADTNRRRIHEIVGELIVDQLR